MEGYWNSQKFLAQLKEAVKLPKCKYPEENGWRVVCVFDHSSCHAAMSDDALDVGKVNANPPGGSEGRRETTCDA